MRVRQSLLLTLALCALTPGLSLAQEDDALRRLRQCAKLDYDDQRLVCYDSVLRPRSASSAAARPTPPPQPPEPSTATTAPAARPPSDFGLSPEQTRSQPQSQQVTVTKIGRDRRGDKYVFTTEDGQIWQQTDSRRIYFSDVPFDAQIRAAAMGSYFLKPVSGTTSLRVRRLR